MKAKLISWLASAGRRLFSLRLVFGLAVTALALEWLRPQPFLDPGHRFSQTGALLLIVAGLLWRAWGAGSAGTHTRSARIDAPRLSTGGAFAHHRNPIYAGSVCAGMGMSLLIGDPVAVAIAGVTFAVLYLAIVPAEEEFLLQQFGDEYRRYCASVPRMVPRLRPWQEARPAEFHWSAALGEVWMALLLAAIYGALLCEEYLDRLGVS